MLQGFSSVVFATVVFASLAAKAYVGSVSAATGEAGRASVEASDTPFMNPAAIAFLKGYYFTASYGSTSQGAAGLQDIALSITENMRDTLVPTSIAYSQATVEELDGDKVYAKDFRLSLGNYYTKNLAFGLGVRHLSVEAPEDRYGQTNLEIGSLWALNESLGLAAVFGGILSPSSSVPEDYRLKQSISVGANYNYKKFMRLKADIITEGNNSFNKPTLAAGMESYMNRWMILRWGLQRNNEKDANLYTAGLGCVLPRFGVHYAYQNSPQDETLTRHSVDLAIPVW